MKDIKDRFISLAKDYQALNKEALICGIGENYVHLLKKSWEQLFSNETPQYYVDDDFYVKYVKYDGMNFICLLTREEYENEKV